LTVPDENDYDAFVKNRTNIWQGENLWLLSHPYFGGQFDADIPAQKN